MDVLESGEEPEPVFHDGAAERADVVLARKRLLRVGRGIIDREPGVERGGAAVEGQVAVKLVRAVLRRDRDRPSGGSSDVRLRVGDADGERLNRVGREILKESADVIVGIVDAVDGEHVVEP